MQARCPRGFVEWFDAFSEIGSTGDGGVDRMEATPANGAARRQLVAWLRQTGLEVRVDRMGNIFGIAELAGPDAPLVMAGSHIDSQPFGGCYDGAYGVIAALAAVAELKARFAGSEGAAKANLAVVAWTGEEGARFRTFLGSAAYVGRSDPDVELDRPDKDGVTAREALAAIGFLGKDAPPLFPSAYVELHVECGEMLETAGARLGIFRRWWGAHKIDIRFLGETSHTGPTPMARRRDALFAAARIIAVVRSMADEAPPLALHTSVAKLIVEPNSQNAVPSAATLSVELRSANGDLIADCYRKLFEAIEAAAAEARVGYEIVRDDLRIPGTFSPELGAIAESVAASMGVKPVSADTIAGHDALMMSEVCPALMLTVPSRAGLCHHPDEWSDPADLQLGAAWLTGVLEELITR
ncbi:MAG: Zn-dependent hydrolase [Rhizobiaceae bacterium]